MDMLRKGKKEPRPFRSAFGGGNDFPPCDLPPHGAEAENRVPHPRPKHLDQLIRGIQPSRYVSPPGKSGPQHRGEQHRCVLQRVGRRNHPSHHLPGRFRLQQCGIGNVEQRGDDAGANHTASHRGNGSANHFRPPMPMTIMRIPTGRMDVLIMTSGFRKRRCNGATRNVPRMLPAAIIPGISPKLPPPLPGIWLQMINIETVAVPITKVRIRLDRIMRTPAVKSPRFSGRAEAIPATFSSAGSPSRKKPALSGRLIRNAVFGSAEDQSPSSVGGPFSARRLT